MLPGWKPLSIGYHGDDGGIFVETSKMTYLTNGTFKEASVGVFIDHSSNDVRFTKKSAWGHEYSSISCLIRLAPHILTRQELYPCVGFHFAKDVIVEFSSFNAPYITNKKSFNDQSKEETNPPFCPFSDHRSSP